MQRALSTGGNGAEAARLAATAAAANINRGSSGGPSGQKRTREQEQKSGGDRALKQPVQPRGSGGGAGSTMRQQRPLAR